MNYSLTLAVLLVILYVTCASTNALELYVKNEAEGNCDSSDSPCLMKTAMERINNDDTTNDNIIHVLGEQINIEETIEIKKSVSIRSENTQFVPCLKNGATGTLFDVANTNITVTLDSIVYENAPEKCYLISNIKNYPFFNINMNKVQNLRGVPVAAPFLRVSQFVITDSEFINTTTALSIGSEYLVIDDSRSLVLSNCRFSGGKGIVLSNFQGAQIQGNKFNGLTTTSLTIEGVDAVVTNNIFEEVSGFKGGALHFVQTPVFPNVRLNVNNNIFAKTEGTYGGAVYLRIRSIYPSWFFKFHDNLIQQSKAVYGGAIYFSSGIPNLNDGSIYGNNQLENISPTKFASSIHNITITKSRFNQYPGADIELEGSLRDYFGNTILSNHEAFDKILIEGASSDEKVWVHSNPILLSDNDKFKILDLEVYGQIGKRSNLVIRSLWVSFVDNEYIKSINCPFVVNFLKCPSYTNQKKVPGNEDLQFCELDPVPQSTYVLGLLFSIGAVLAIFAGLVVGSIKLTACLRNRKFNTIYTNL